LFRLSQFAFNKNNKELYDSIYNELMALKASDGIGTIEPVVEVNHEILNGNYQEALRLCQELSPEKRAERMAVIYHRMGDNDKAYEQMAKFKKINDSIVLVSHGNVVASCYVQMNNERLKLEQKLLEEENAKLKRWFIFTVIGLIVLALALVLLQHHLRIRHLEQENERLEKERKKAEKAFDMKNEFITNITNELRAPLNPIEGFSDILGTKDYELQPEEREELSNMIKDSSKTITKLIDELAELSLYESKKSLPMNYTMSPNHLCRHMVDALRPRCKDGVRMYYETELPEHYEVHTNQEGVEALLRHLIENAIQYTDQGVITVACSEYEDQVRVSVTDTGKGISPERRSHVFDTFREMGENQKLQGLGLSICKAIVKLLGGKIWLDEQYTEGSRFIFELPKK
jgi:signal transduction histidine kinase